MFKSRIIADNISRLNFKYRDKLRHALSYNKMEHVNDSEFKKILKKFNKYLLHSEEIDSIKTLDYKPTNRILKK